MVVVNHGCTNPQQEWHVDNSTTTCTVNSITTTTTTADLVESPSQRLPPTFVQNVSTWLDSMNTTYDLCLVPLSSIRPSLLPVATPSPPLTLYLLRLVVSTPSDVTHRTTGVVAHRTITVQNGPVVPSLLPPPPPPPESSSTTVLLHLIPSPTSLQNCIPAGVTQYMTDHPDLVWATLPRNINGPPKSTTTNRAHIHGNIQMIHLHEDTWNDARTKSIVQSRLLFRLGGGASTALIPPQRRRRRLYARQTIVKRIDRPTARTFLLQHHLWGTTHAKYAYGLYDKTTIRTHDTPSSNDDNVTVEHGPLVAVATFSSRRNVRRGTGPEQRIYRSCELIRTCSAGDLSIVGGISKLISAFRKDHPVDDIVTVIDRDWGVGRSNWYTLGFRTVATMLPIPMVIYGKDGTRRHLIGAGIQSDDDPNRNIENDDTPLIRWGLPKIVLSELETITSYTEAVQCLHRHNYYLTYDAGVERLFLLVSKQRDNESVQSLWNSSIPQYVAQHYSSISGIDAIIQHVAKRQHF